MAYQVPRRPLVLMPSPSQQNAPTLAVPSGSSNGGPVDGGTDSAGILSPQMLQLFGLNSDSDPNGPYGPLMRAGLDDGDGGPSGGDPLSGVIDALRQGYSLGPRSLDDRFREYDQIDPIDPDAQSQADALQGQYDSGVGPASDAYSKLLAQGQPAYQPAHVSPWLVALGAGLGALQNGIEPQNQTGAQNWLAGPLEQAQQSAQDAYVRARQDYASRLDNAHNQYDLARDRSKTYLEQAQRIEDDLREHAGRRAEYVAKGILQDQNATQQQKQALLQQLLKSEQSRLQTEAQGRQGTLNGLLDLRLRMMHDLWQKGDVGGLSKLLQDDYMDGRGQNPDGSPLYPHDVANLQHIHGSAMNGPMEKTARVLGQRIRELTAQQAKMHADSIRRQVERLQRVFGPGANNPSSGQQVP